MTTFVPASMPEQALYRFRVGGINLYDAAQPSPRMAMKHHMAHEATTWLANHPGGCVVFEASSVRPSDPWIANRSEVRLMVHGEQVYTYVQSSDANAAAGESLVMAASTFAEQVYPPLIGVFAMAPEVLARQNARRTNADGPDLDYLAANFSRIVVGAYDGEGYLVWRFPRNAR